MENKIKAIHFIDLFSQCTLRLTSSCTYQCSFCEQWKDSEKASQKWVEIINSGRFFKMFPKRKLFNIVGGDPYINEHIGFIIAYLNSQKIKIRCWTNGYIPVDLIAPSIQYINEVMLYIPAVDPTEFQLISGYGTWSEFESMLSYLKNENTNIILNFPIKPDNLHYLPDIYKFAFQEKCKLLIHFNKKDDYSIDELESISYYYRVKKVDIYHTHDSENKFCAAFPGTGMQDKVQILRNTWREMVNGVYGEITL